jgi:hypothetical protein
VHATIPASILSIPGNVRYPLLLFIIAAEPGAAAPQQNRSDGHPRLRWLLVAPLPRAAMAPLLSAVPRLPGVLRQIGRRHPAYMVVAIALELAAYVSFVVVFRLFRPGLSGARVRRLVWAEEGYGALLRGGTADCKRSGSAERASVDA